MPTYAFWKAILCSPTSARESSFPFHRQSMKHTGEKVEINVRIAVTLVKWAIEAIFFSHKSFAQVEGQVYCVCKSEIHTQRCA